MELRDDLPDWIESRIETENYDNKLTQRHVASQLVHGDRPYYSITKLKAAMGNEPSRDTVRNRLDELSERDVVKREYINNGEVFWINHPDSQWPIPNDVEVNEKSNELTITEWRSQNHIRISALSVILAILGTSIVLIGTFQAGNYYQTPVGTSDILASGLTLGLVSYLGFFLAGIIWIFSEYDFDVSKVQDD